MLWALVLLNISEIVLHSCFVHYDLDSENIHVISSLIQYFMVFRYVEELLGQMLAEIGMFVHYPTGTAFFVTFPLHISRSSLSLNVKVGSYEHDTLSFSV